MSAKNININQATHITHFPYSVISQIEIPAGNLVIVEPAEQIVTGNTKTNESVQILITLEKLFVKTKTIISSSIIGQFYTLLAAPVK